MELEPEPVHLKTLCFCSDTDGLSVLCIIVRKNKKVIPQNEQIECSMHHRCMCVIAHTSVYRKHKHAQLNRAHNVHPSIKFDTVFVGQYGNLYLP